MKCKTLEELMGYQQGRLDKVREESVMNTDSVEISPRLMAIMNKALHIAQERKDIYMGTEHVLAAMLDYKGLRKLLRPQRLQYIINYKPNVSREAERGVVK